MRHPVAAPDIRPARFPQARRVVVLLCLAATLTACGTKGALRLPPGPPPAPLLGNAAPLRAVTRAPAQPVAAPAALPVPAAADDTSMSKDASR